MSMPVCQHCFKPEMNCDCDVPFKPAICTVCQDDGWIAYPTFADVERKVIRIRKVRCPRGCPLADPDEPGVLQTFDEGDCHQ